MSDEQRYEADEAETTPKRASGTRRRSFLALLVVAVVLIGLVALTPSILSTDFAVSKIVSVIDRSVAGSVKVRSVSLSWFSGQRVDGLEVLDPTGKSVLNIERVFAERSLWQLISSAFSADIGAVKIQGFTGSVVVDESGSSNLWQALGPPPEATREPEPRSAERSRVLAPLAFDIELTDARLTVTAPNSHPVIFENIQAKASGALAESIRINLSGRSRQGDLSGNFIVKGRLENLLGPNGEITADSASGEFEAKAAALPVQGIDQLLGMRGLLDAALGSWLDLTVTADVATAAQQLTVSVKAPNLTADIDGRISERVFVLTRPASVRFIMTGELVERLAHGSGATAKLRLAKSVPLRLTVEQLRWRLAAFDPAKMALRVTLDAEKGVQLSGAMIGNLTMDDLQARLETENAANAIIVAIRAAMMHDGKPGRVQVNAELSDLFTTTGRLQLNKLRADALMHVTNLPTALIDRISGQGGLLVEALGPKMTVRATSSSTGAERTEVKLAIKTARLSAKVPLIITDVVQNTGPIGVNYQLSSRVAARYIPKDTGVRLRPNTPIHLTLAKLSAPLPKPGEPFFQLGKTLVHADLQVGAITMARPGTAERITVDAIAARVRGTSLADLRVSAAATALITGEPGVLRKALGPRAELKARVLGGVGSGNNFVARDVLLNVTSSRLSLELPARLSADLTVSLTQPARVDYTVTPELLAHFGLESKDLPTIAGRTRVHVTLDRLEAPLQEFRLEKLQLALNSTITAASARDVIGVLLGPTVKLALRLEDPPASKAGRGNLQVTVRIASEKVKADVAAVLTTDDTARLALVKPATVDAVVTPEGLTMLNVIENGQRTIAGPTPVHVKIDRLSASVQPFDLASVHMAIKAAVKKLELVGDERLAGVSLSDAIASLEFDGSAGTSLVTLDANAFVPGQPGAGPLAASAKFSKLFHEGKLNARSAAVDANLKLDGLPTVLVEAMSGHGGKLVPLVGPILQLDAGAKLTGGEKRIGVVDVKATSHNLSVDVGVKLGEMIELSRPARAKLVVAPAAYAALTKPARAPGPKPGKAPPGYVLAAPVTIDATLNALAWPMGHSREKRFEPSKASIDATFMVPRIALNEDATGRGVVINNLGAFVKAPSLAGPIAFTVKGNISPSVPGTRPGVPPPTGTLRVSGDVRDAFTAGGGFKTAGLSTNVSAEVQQLPVALLDSWLRQHGMVLATLGPELSISAKAQLTKMNGPVTLTATATHAKASMNGLLQSGNLTFTKPLVADLEVTEELGKRVLAKINPLFETAHTSERPIGLEINHDGVFIPVERFDLRKVVIKNATLDLGRIALKNGGLLTGVIGLAQRFGQPRGASKEDMIAWFTPLRWRMEDGRIEYTRRLDLLVDGSHHLASWGMVDQANNRVDMVLAIMPETLDKIFNIENVDPNDALRIPITGSASRPQVDFQKAAVDLARLQAQSRLGSKKGSGRLGGLLAGLAKEILGRGNSGASDSGRIPPPSVEPLPWDRLLDPRTSQQQQQPAAIEKPATGDPLGKALREGLRRIFK